MVFLKVIGLYIYIYIYVCVYLYIYIYLTSMGGMLAWEAPMVLVWLKPGDGKHGGVVKRGK